MVDAVRSITAAHASSLRREVLPRLRLEVVTALQGTPDAQRIREVLDLASTYVDMVAELARDWWGSPERPRVPLIDDQILSAAVAGVVIVRAALSEARIGGGFPNSAWREIRSLVGPATVRSALACARTVRMTPPAERSPDGLILPVVLAPVVAATLGAVDAASDLVLRQVADALDVRPKPSSSTAMLGLAGSLRRWQERAREWLGRHSEEADLTLPDCERLLAEGEAVFHGLTVRENSLDMSAWFVSDKLGDLLDIARRDDAAACAALTDGEVGGVVARVAAVAFDRAPTVSRQVLPSAEVSGLVLRGVELIDQRSLVDPDEEPLALALADIGTLTEVVLELGHAPTLIPASEYPALVASVTTLLTAVTDHLTRAGLQPPIVPQRRFDLAADHGLH